VRLRGTLAVTSWQEDELRTVEGDGRVTRAAIGYQVSGDAEGEAFSDVAMYYRADGTAVIAGLWTITGMVGGHAGGLVFEATGEYDGSMAASRVRAVPGSGTGALEGAVGEGTTTATSRRVDYDLELQV
jgi:Protein of unknown function (DUF3224)